MSIIDDFKDINRRMNRKQERPPVQMGCWTVRIDLPMPDYEWQTDTIQNIGNRTWIPLK